MGVTTKKQQSGQAFSQTLALFCGLCLVVLAGIFGADRLHTATLPQDSVVADTLGKETSPDYLALLSNRESAHLTLFYLNEALGAALDEEDLPFFDLPKLTALAQSIPQGLTVEAVQVAGSQVTVLGSCGDQETAQQLLDSLSTSGVFQDEILLTVTSDGEGTCHFTLVYTEDKF